MHTLGHCLAVAALGAAGLAAAQSTGSMTSPQSGAASAGGGPVGMVLPSTVQGGTTAPTQPGHAITGDRDIKPPPAHYGSRESADANAVARRDPAPASNASVRP